jgi:uncharacterized protein (DUF4415 family)
MTKDNFTFSTDPEMAEFEAALLRSVEQAKRGEFARVHTPEDIVARRGRPAGSVKADAKIPVKIRLNREVVDALRATGRGWQTRVNELLMDSDNVQR